MKKTIIFAFSVLLALAGCKNTEHKTTETMNRDQIFQEVAGRKNFGPDHALVTTPQPCVMIATWDENKNPCRDYLYEAFCRRPPV